MDTKKITALLVGILIVGGLLWYATSQPTPTVLEEEAEITEEVEESTDSALSGTWLWKETLLNSGELVRPEKTGAFTVVFGEEGTISGTTDCNSFSGSYEAGEGNTLTFGPFASTKMFCEGSQEAEFTRMVIDSTSFLITPMGDLVLHIKFDSGSVIFTRKP